MAKKKTKTEIVTEEIAKNDNLELSENEDSISKEERYRKRAKYFIRVGKDYYKYSMRPTVKNKPYKVLIPWNKDNIKDDYGAGVLKYIPKYDGFVTLPSHVDYRQSVSNWYNNYYQLSHVPQEGSFENIMSLLMHIFGEKYIDFIIDYIQLLYLEPTRDLPIILLESEERNTGKSTFGFLIEKMFQENTITLGNADLASQFNEIWIQKLAIIVDETTLEERSVLQTIKRLSTSGDRKTVSNAKNKGQINVEFIGKFIFMSNDEGKALPIERGETRFAVFKVKSLPQDSKEEGKAFHAKIESEIPAFLHFLSNRTLIHPDKGRMYFSPEVYFTDQLKLYFKGSKSYIAQAIQDLITDTFETFPDEEKLCFSLSNIYDELVNGGYAKFVDRLKLRKVIEDEFRLQLSKRGRYTYFSYSRAEKDSTYLPSRNECNNTFYTFIRDNYIISYENNTIPVSRKMEQTALF